MASAEKRILIDQYKLGRKAIKENLNSGSVSVPLVSDEILYGIPDFRGVFSKGFVGHTGDNDVPKYPNKTTYQKFIDGLNNKNINLINEVLVTNPRLSDPYSLFDFEIQGKNRFSYVMDPAPSPTSDQGAAELLEVYAMALLRDYQLVALDPSCSLYISIPQPAKDTINKYIEELNKNNIQTNLKCPVNSQNKITPELLFRGSSQGCIQGPYASQFIYYPVVLGTLLLEQQNVLLDTSFNTIDFSNNDLGITTQYFIEIWNGTPKPAREDNITIRYLTTMRDFALYINRDEVWQPFFITGGLFLDYGIPTGFYSKNRSSGPSRFVNLGVVDLWTIMMKAVKLAMNSAWVWKWKQLRQRPEEMAYQVHLKKKYPSDPSGVNFKPYLLSDQNVIMADISNNNKGNFLMPLAYRQGSPFHPSYPGGHATIAGACITILKAWFNCDTLIKAYIPDLSGNDLLEYRIGVGSTANVYYKISDELDKLANNCGITRNFSGIHYRSDDETGIKLGESVAIDLLKEEISKYRDDITFRFRKLDGTIQTISNHNNPLPSNLSYTIYFEPRTPFDASNYREIKQSQQPFKPIELTTTTINLINSDGSTSTTTTVNAPTSGTTKGWTNLAPRKLNTSRTGVTIIS
jgi:hypothetical protein